MIRSQSVCLLCRKLKPIAPGYNERTPICIDCVPKLKESKLGGKVLFSDYWDAHIFVPYKSKGR